MPIQWTEMRWVPGVSFFCWFVFSLFSDEKNIILLFNCFRQRIHNCFVLLPVEYWNSQLHFFYYMIGYSRKSKTHFWWINSFTFLFFVLFIRGVYHEEGENKPGNYHHNKDEKIIPIIYILFKLFINTNFTFSWSSFCSFIVHYLALHSNTMRKTSASFKTSESRERFPPGQETHLSFGAWCNRKWTYFLVEKSKVSTICFLHMHLCVCMCNVCVCVFYIMYSMQLN